MRPEVEIGEVQGNVLRRYPREFDSALHVRLRVPAAPALRRVVAGWLRARVSFEGAEHGLPPYWARKPRVNLAFTCEGLAKWGVPTSFLYAFPEEFRKGARQRAAWLGDSWQKDADRFPPADLLLSVHGTSPEDCRTHAEELLAEGAGGFEVASRRTAGYAVAGTRAHFGFLDGLSQPAIEGVDVDPVGNGVYVGLHRRRGSLLREQLSLRPLERRWRLIRTGEFLLGYDNEDDELPPGPPAPLGPNGTFMVYREIEQHVEAFDRYVTEWAQRLSISREQLRAKIVGRWRGGTPSARHPGSDAEDARREPGNPREDADLSGRQRRLNDFSYADDPKGWGCPLGAHVRRGNPRDALPGGAERSMRHRIIRRGLPYGERGKERGTAFVCLSASIASGFEYIQRNWLNGGDAFGLGEQPDFLLQQPGPDGKPTGRMVIQGYSPVVLPAPPEPFVTVRGCDYLFVPSRRACAWLADLVT